LPNFGKVRFEQASLHKLRIYSKLRIEIIIWECKRESNAKLTLDSYYYFTFTTTRHLSDKEQAIQTDNVIE